MAFFLLDTDILSLFQRGYVKVSLYFNVFSPQRGVRQ